MNGLAGVKKGKPQPKTENKILLCLIAEVHNFATTLGGNLLFSVPSFKQFISWKSNQNQTSDQ
jgi:hypothetical protein